MQHAHLIKKYYIMFYIYRTITSTYLCYICGGNTSLLIVLRVPVMVGCSVLYKAL